MRIKIRFGTAIVCLLTFFAGERLFAQATGSISGTVTDPTGSAVPGAKVTVTAPATGLTRSSTTNDSGHYIIPLLGVATYNVKVEQPGFQEATAQDIRLQVDEHRELDFKLSPATVQTTVEVTATPVAVQTTDATLGQVITTQQVADLPLNGRDFVQLATLTPGTAQETNPQSFFNGGPSSEASARGSYSLSVGGSRANSTDWLLDGNDNNELTSGAISILSSIDSIQEFKVLTYNYSAEWGTRGGPTVLINTKSGSDQFHGTLFEFLRNTDLDARSFFASSTEKFNLNQFGASFGGPIRKDKTFFFVDYEEKYQRHGTAFTGLVPSVAMRNGDFSHDAFGNPSKIQLINPNATQMANGSAVNVPFMCDSGGNALPGAADGSQSAGTPCDKIPQSLIDPVGQKLINLYPLPNANNAALGYNFVSEPVRKLDEGKFDIRLDENISSTDTLFARFSYDQAGSYVPGGAPGFAEQGAFASNQSIINHARNAAISETHIFSPRTVNQVSGGFNRIFDYITSQGTGSCAARSLGIPGANLGGLSCGLTSVSMPGGYWSLGDRGYTPFIGGTNVWMFSDSLDMVRGAHDIRIGGSFRANQLNTEAVGFPNGFWVVSGLWTGEPQADLLTGLSSLAFHDQEFGGSNTGRRWKLYRPFVEDNWRVSKSLTLNLGLAWALVTPISEVANRQSDFNPANGQFLIAGQNAGPSAGINMDLTALEPRLGAAWKPFSSSNTVVRGGYAIFHDSSWNMGAQGLWQNPPYYAESDAFAFGGSCTVATAACAKNGLTPSGIIMSQGFPTFTSPPNPANFTGTIYAQNTNFKQGRIQQFNVNVEQEIPGQIVLTVGYAGSRSSHILGFGNNINVSSPSACGTVSGYTLGCGPNGAAFGVPYSAFPFSTIDDVFDAGRAHYNSLQVKAETKSTRYGIYALIGYTYSRAYDTGFADGLGSIVGATYFPLPNWQKLDWGLSQINLNHNFTASIIYQLPFGKGRKWGNNWNCVANAIGGGWEMTVIEKATSGFPIFVVDTNNFSSGVSFSNGNGTSQIRPNQTCNPVLSHPTLSQWFNAACFSQPAPGELGNANRTPLSGPDFVNTDFSIIKHFVPREGMRIDFRTEFFNLFNHAQFGIPGANLGADFNSPSTFTVINYTVNNPRLIQFALKLAF
jgi:hypothetical protein